MSGAHGPTEVFGDARPMTADALRDCAPTRGLAFGPAVSERGYYVGRVEGNLYRVTDGTYQSAFLTTSDGVVLFDAPPTIGHNIQRAVNEIAAANGVTNKVTHLIYSHHHADHTGTSSLFDRNIARIGHEEDAKVTAPRRRSRTARARGNLPGPPYPRDGGRAHRAGLARLQSLAGQHLYPICPTTLRSCSST